MRAATGDGVGVDVFCRRIVGCWLRHGAANSHLRTELTPQALDGNRRAENADMTLYECLPLGSPVTVCGAVREQPLPNFVPGVRQRERSTQCDSISWRRVERPSLAPAQREIGALVDGAVRFSADRIR